MHHRFDFPANSMISILLKEILLFFCILLFSIQCLPKAYAKYTDAAFSDSQAHAAHFNVQLTAEDGQPDFLRLDDSSDTLCDSFQIYLYNRSEVPASGTLILRLSEALPGNCSVTLEAVDTEDGSVPISVSDSTQTEFTWELGEFAPIEELRTYRLLFEMEETAEAEDIGKAETMTINLSLSAYMKQLPAEALSE